MNLSDEYTRRVLNSLLRGDAFSAPGAMYLYPCSNTPSNTVVGTPIGSLKHTMTMSLWTNLVAGRVSTYDSGGADPISFTMTGSGSIRGWVVSTSSTGAGVTLANTVLFDTANKAYSDSEVVTVPVGTLTCEMD